MKKESKSETNITQAHNVSDSDSSGYSLSITPIGCCSEEFESILGMDGTYHVCPKREWFASFKKLDTGLVTFDNGHTCQVEAICTVRIKLFHGMIRELKDVRHIPHYRRI